MFAKCDALPNEICSTCFVSGIHSLYLFLQRHSTHEDIRESVRVDFWVANPARTSPGSVFELWISDGFELFFRRTFSVPKICPRSIQATHACHSEVSNRCFGLWSPRPFVPSFDVGPMFTWNRNKSHEQSRIVEIQLLATSSLCGLEAGCQPFICPCSLNVMHWRKEVYVTCLSKESMPFVKSKPPLPSRSLRSLRAAARSTSSLHHACKRELWYPRCGLQDIDCDLGCLV